MNALKAKRWAVLALISLAFNLFLGGLALGKLIRPEHPPRDMGPIAIFRASRDLDPGSQKIIDRIRKEHHDEIGNGMRGAAEAREAALDALCAEQFDEAKAREAFDVFRERSQRTHGQMHESLIAIAKAMSPEQRVRLREVMLRDRKKGGGRWRGPSGHPGPQMSAPAISSSAP